GRRTGNCSDRAANARRKRKKSPPPCRRRSTTRAPRPTSGAGPTTTFRFESVRDARSRRGTRWGRKVSTGVENQEVQAGDPSPRQKSGNITTANEQLALAA